MTDPLLLQRVRSALARHGVPSAEPGAPVLVGVSGGRDSLVLLHLLRFSGLIPSRLLHALHVDHGMRGESSAADARWLEGLGRSWQVPLRVARSSPSTAPPRTEAEARTLRYEALRAEATRLGAAFVLLAHHAEDQAETVLFRLLRGTGPRGLAGIPEARPLGSATLVRPLLSAPGSEVEAWAQRTGIRPREDPTNRDPVHRRNWIRHHLLPRLEAGAPGTRDLLLALSSEARLREVALGRVVEAALEGVVRETSDGSITVARDSLLLYPEPLQGELLRELLRRLGGRVSRRGLALALRFASRGEGGRQVTVGPGVRVARRGNRIRVEVDRPGGTPPETAPGARNLPAAGRVFGRACDRPSHHRRPRHTDPRS